MLTGAKSWPNPTTIFALGLFLALGPVAWGDQHGGGDAHSQNQGSQDSDDGHHTPPPPPAPEPPTCSISSSAEVNAEKILGGHVIHFSAESILPFLNANHQLADAQLWVLLSERDNDDRRGHHDHDSDKRDIEEMTLALNGTATQKANGRGHFEFSKELKGGLVARAPLGNLRLKGTEPALRFMERLSLQRGILTIWVRGPFKVLKAKLILGASQGGDCNPGPVNSAPPTVTITSENPGSSPTNQTGIMFTFQADQSGVTFKCSLDGATPVLCSSPWSQSALADGAHQFQVVAVNAAGTSSSPAIYNWSIDNTAPDITITSVVPAASYTSSPTIAASFTSSKAATTFQCSLDGGTPATCVSPVNYAGLLDGAHTIDITGTDSLGNMSASPAHYFWTVDQTPPQVSIVQTVNADTVTTQTSPTFYFTANESASFQCALDGLAYAACQSPALLTNLLEGPHKFSVVGTDAAGNVSTPATYSWTIDLTPPVITLGNVVPAPGLTNATSAFVEYSVNEMGSTVSCTLDGVPLAACASPLNFAFAAEGAHELALVATDQAGNASAPTLIDWTVDLTAPIVSFSQILPSAASYIASSSLTVTLVGSEPIQYQAYIDGILLSQTSGATLQLTGLLDGAHSLVVDARDYAGNAAQPITHNFTVDTVAPTVAISSVQYAALTNQTSNSFTFSSSKTVQFECNLDLAGYVPCGSTYAAASLAEGTHTLSIYGIDLAGIASAAISYSWKIDLTPPKTTISAVTPAGATINSSSVAVQFAVSEAASSYCSLDGAAAATCTSPFSPSGLSSGSHNIQIYSNDVAGNKETSPASYSFTVDTAVPVLSLSSSVGALTNSTQIQFTFSANEAVTFTCTLDGVANQGCTSPVSYSGLTAGTHTFTLGGANLAGTNAAPASFQWTINTTPPAVTVQGTPSASDPSTWTFTLNSNVTGTSFQCSMDGAAYASCPASYTLSGLADGGHTLNVTGTDQTGNTSQPTAFSFTVQTPVSTSITSVNPSTSPTNNNSIAISFTSNEANASFLCSLDGSAFAACSSPASYFNLVDGTHQFVVKAVAPNGAIDQAGASYSWTVDTVVPQITSITTSVTSTTITINWSTNVSATGAVHWGPGSNTSNVIAAGGGFGTSHTVTITGLTHQTVYSYVVSGNDQAGNFYSSSMRAIRTAP
ncbi:MAG: Ig-like domain-containing protein [Bdellovibrionota bacterium]